VCSSDLPKTPKPLSLSSISEIINIIFHWFGLQDYPSEESSWFIISHFQVHS